MTQTDGESQLGKRAERYLAEFSQPADTEFDHAKAKGFMIRGLDQYGFDMGTISVYLVVDSVLDTQFPLGDTGFELGLARVRKELRGSGVGTALMERAIREAANRGRLDGRFTAHSAGSIGMLERLKAKGLVGDAIYAIPVDEVTLNTSGLGIISLDEAVGRLTSAPDLGFYPNDEQWTDTHMVDVWFRTVLE